MRDARGAYLRILQADQTVYLHPHAARPWGPAIEVGSDLLPDVVLEVDNTTDVRRGKLGLYESWGFPEVWVEVPDTPSPSRPARLRPGLTIHLLGDQGFRTAATSRAFPGWSADEIHRALNEPELSAATTAALRRVGRALGAAEGTGPDDDPLLHAERLEGHAKGRAEGRTEAASAAVLQVFKARGLRVSAARCPDACGSWRRSPPRRWCKRRWIAATRPIFCASCPSRTRSSGLQRRHPPVGSDAGRSAGCDPSATWWRCSGSASSSGW